MVLNKSMLDKPVASSAIDLPDGSKTGDIIRWNSETGAWEAVSEPLAFTQVNLTPQSEAVEDVEGGMYFNSVDKGVYVCVEDS